MASHHYVGTGRPSLRLLQAADDPNLFENTVSDLVHAAGLHVVSRQSSLFSGGGLTVAWILSESHLVVHFWGPERVVTFDLHVCDYSRSNRSRAEALVRAITDCCFEAPEPVSWKEIHVAHPGEDHNVAKDS